jgi:hypothetical protein
MARIREYGQLLKAIKLICNDVEDPEDWGFLDVWILRRWDKTRGIEGRNESYGNA